MPAIPRPSFHRRNDFWPTSSGLLTLPELYARIFVAAIRDALSVSNIGAFLIVVRGTGGERLFIARTDPICNISVILSDSLACLRVPQYASAPRGGLLVSALTRYSRAHGHGDASEEEIAKPDDVDSVLIGNSVHQIPIN